MDIARIFDEQLVDLGDSSGEDFAGILAPASEVGKLGTGVTRQFLEDAASYHEKYFDIGYSTYLIETACGALGIQNDPELILDVGSGSGPSVFALLEKFKTSEVVATDVSIQLLAILNHALQHRQLTDRCTTMCLDLNKPWFKGEPFNIAVGSAILHHLFDPGAFIEQIFSAVRPGGAAFFFEPFEPGNATMQIIYRLLLAQQRQSGDLSENVAEFFTNKIVQLAEMKCEPKDTVAYADIDDKWVFTRQFFANIADRIGASKLVIFPINRSDQPFTNMMKTQMRLGLGLGEDALPDWAWRTIADIEASLSMSCKDDLLIEGCVAFVK